MSEIMTPDDAGGIGQSPSSHSSLLLQPTNIYSTSERESWHGPDLDTIVSFIIIPARKGFQAAAVTIADPPKKEEVIPDEAPLETAIDKAHVSKANETFGSASETTGSANETFGGANETFGGADETFGEANGTFADATSDTWGSGGWWFRESLGAACKLRLEYCVHLDVLLEIDN